jgi:thioredoxin-like negative regulator of GroEL
LGDKAVYIKVNVEENEEVPDLLQVDSLPAMVCVKNKEKVADMKGSKTENYINLMKKNAE